MLKGRTTIQLRNAKTGELEQEVTEENLVTNAVQNMMSMPYFARVGQGNKEADGNTGDFERRLLHNNVPIYKNAYGGITLFKNEHEESVDKILPDGNNEVIGYAGGQGSTEFADDNRCGEFNATESKALDNGYHFVWDFDTEKSNGTFKSVSLGVRNKIVYKRSNDSYGEILSTNLSISDCQLISLVDFKVDYPRLSDGLTKAHPATIVKLVETPDKQFVDVYAVFCGANTTTTKFCIQKIRLRMPHIRTLTQTSAFAEVSRETLLDWTTPPKFWVGSFYETTADGSVRHNVFLDDDKINFIYRNSSSASSGDTQTITHTIYDLDGKQISTVDITAPEKIKMSSSKTTMPAIYRDGYYYSRAGTNIIQYNAQGVLNHSVGLINIGDDTVEWSFTDFGYLKFHAQNFHAYIMIDDSGLHFVHWSNQRDVFLFPVNHNISSVKKPWELFIGGYSGNYANIIIGLDPYYLGTINNLEKSITKTDAQTMKIIYDLTEEAEE